jgi:hypothetical protein
VVGASGWATACAVLLVIALIDLVVILRRIRQGPHFQPGRDVPPYLPPSGSVPPPYRSRTWPHLRGGHRP